MPDIFCYPALVPHEDIRLCDPLFLCVAAPAPVVVVPGGRARPVRQRRRRSWEPDPAEKNAELAAIAAVAAGKARKADDELILDLLQWDVL